MRRGPNIENCPERLKALLDVFADDVETQRAILLDKLEFVLTEGKLHHRRVQDLWRYLPPDYGEGLRGYCTDKVFVEAALEIVELGQPSMEVLDNIAEGLMSVGYLSHFAPPFFAQRIERVIATPFYFIHFTAPGKAKRIAREGFKGRVRREDLQSTRHGQTDDSHAPLKLGTGYIYAYLLNAASAGELRAEIDAEGAFIKTGPDGDEALAAARSSAVVGRAQMGLLVFHKLDNEPQLLIPVECIEDGSVLAMDVPTLVGHEYYDEEDEEDDDEYDEEDDEDDDEYDEEGEDED